MTEPAFTPDGSYGGIPYRVLATGRIEALLSGRVVRLDSIEQLIGIVSGRTSLEPAPSSNDFATQEPATELETAYKERPSPAAIALTKPRRRGRGFFWLIVFPILLYFAIGLISGSGQVARKVVNVLNSEYGGVSKAELEGWGSNTLKIDWTSRTNKLNSIGVFAAVSTAKSALYNDGIRYFKFPNDAGGYNIIDWKTGEKTSVSERAPYYFR